MEETVPENLRHDVIATEIWPIERIVAYARNPRKNDIAVQRMAAAIRELLGRPAALRAMGEAGRRLVGTHYSWDVITDHLAGLYAQTVSAKA